MEKDNDRIIVSINCLTYNHAKYIRQCLDGFVMQQTDFRYEAIVHDDASTDGTTEIVREYADRYPDIIVPIFESENQYSKGIPGKLTRLLEDRSRGEYIAICEGDDYWTDPLKLQKQVEHMERHPECTMSCNRTKMYSVLRKKYIGENYCYNKDRTVAVEDVVKRGGLFVSTCSVVYRKEIKGPDYPDYCIQCHIGDYPLQIMAAMKGTIYYFNDVMSVYRVENSASWAGQIEGISVDKLISIVRSEVTMLKGFSLNFPRYSDLFQQRIASYINCNIPKRGYSSSDQKQYIQAFRNEMTTYSFLWKVDRFINSIRIRGIAKVYSFIFLINYSVKLKKYSY